MRIPSCFHAIPRQWRTPKTLIAFFAVELALTVAALALYGIAAPDLYRTSLWQEGSNHGWNSNPNELVYAAANYRPVVEPLPWSQLYVSMILYSQYIMTDCIVQHHRLQRRHLCTIALYRSLQDDHVHHPHLPSASLAPDPSRSLRPLRRQYPRSSGTRHEQQGPPPVWSAMVHHQVLRTTGRGESERILYAGKRRFRRDCPTLVR